MANTNLIINEILKIQDTTELNQVVSEIKEAMKIVRSRDLQSKKAQWKVGDEVSVLNRKTRTRIFGEITKIKRSYADVNEDGMIWNVPITLLEPWGNSSVDMDSVLN